MLRCLPCCRSSQNIDPQTKSKKLSTPVTTASDGAAPWQGDAVERIVPQTRCSTAQPTAVLAPPVARETTGFVSRQVIAWMPWMMNRVSSYLQMRGFEIRDVQTSIGQLRCYVCYNPRAQHNATVIMCHGFGSEGLDFFKLALRVKQDARYTIFFDMPGHGFSAALPAEIDMNEIILAIHEGLQQLIQTDSVVAYGNSMGGYIALRLAQLKNTFVKLLVLNSPAGAPMTVDEIRKIQDVFSVDTDEKAQRFLDLFLPDGVPFGQRSILVGALQRRFSREDHRRLAASIDSALMFSAEEVHALRVPIRITWGTLDQILPKSSAEFWREVQSDQLRFEYVNASHSRYVKHPNASRMEILAGILALASA